MQQIDLISDLNTCRHRAEGSAIGDYDVYAAAFFIRQQWMNSA